MGKYILGASEFFLNEAISSASDWPDNWKDMPEWAALQELGFRDATTPQMEKNGNILLMNDTNPIYPGGITLQQSGYIRNKLASSGFIRKYPGGFTLKQMFDYLIERFSKLTKKGVERSESHGDLPDLAVTFLNKVVKGTWRFNPETQRIDTSGNVFLSKIKSMPEGIRFGVVGGGFECDYMGLTNLEIAPTEVVGSFDCSNNNLTSLEGCPQRVGGNFLCSNNKITSLVGAPDYIIGSFICDSNNLTTLEGGPRNVGVRFDCSRNPITSFEGAPTMAAPDGQFFADKTLIKDLTGLPPVGQVNLANCKNLTSIVDLPDTVHSILLAGIGISCYDNNRGGYKDISPKSLIYKAVFEILNKREEALGSNAHRDAIPPIEIGGYSLYVSVYRDTTSRKEREKSVALYATLLDENQLDKYFTENPMNLDVLDELPEIKAGVLKRTGMRDISKIAKAMRRGII